LKLHQKNCKYLRFLKNEKENIADKIFISAGIVDISKVLDFSTCDQSRSSEKPFFSFSNFTMAAGV